MIAARKEKGLRMLEASMRASMARSQASLSRSSASGTFPCVQRRQSRSSRGRRNQQVSSKPKASAACARVGLEGNGCCTPDIYPLASAQSISNEFQLFTTFGVRRPSACRAHRQWRNQMSNSATPLRNKDPIDFWHERFTPLFPRQASEPLARLWARLIAGEFVITAHSEDEQECSLGLAKIPREQRLPMCREQARITEEVLLGRPQKSLAIDLDVSASTVCSNAARGLQRLGLSGSVSRAPLGLVMAAASHRVKQRFVAPGWPARWTESDARLEFTMSRPDSQLRPWLSAVEFEIVQLALTGISHQEIAERRGRSERTVANQLHSIYAKLEVSGRFQLTHLAVALGSYSVADPSPKGDAGSHRVSEPPRSRLRECANQIRFYPPLLDLLRQVPSAISSPLAAAGF